MFDKLLKGLPVIGGLFDDSEEKAMGQLQKNQDLYSGLSVPDIERLGFSPEEYSLAGDIRPEDASYQTVSEDPRLRSSQLQNLAGLSELAQNGLSDVDKLGYNQARQIGSQQAQARRQSAMQDAQARGVAGGGLEQALREMGSQEGANRAQQAGLQQAADSSRQRALYQQAYGDSLSQMRGQDLTANQSNANIINQFNMANTQARNQAQQQNLANHQQVGNANVDQRNAGHQQKIDLAQQAYQNQLNKVQGQTGANMGAAQGYAAESAANANRRKAAGALVGAGVGFAASGGSAQGAMAGSAIGGGLGG